MHIISPMLDLKVKYALPAAKKPVGGEIEVPAEKQIPSITEYTKVSEENLFHPERKIPVEKKEEKPLPKPEFVLYGTLITDTISLAYLEDLKVPRSTVGRGKRQISMKKGDTLSGFTLKEIEADKIVMVRGEEKMVVSLNDPAHPKKRESQGTVAQATEQKEQRFVPKTPAIPTRQQNTPKSSDEPATVKQQVPAPAAAPAVPKAPIQPVGSDPRKTFSDFLKGQAR